MTSEEDMKRRNGGGGGGRKNFALITMMREDEIERKRESESETCDIPGTSQILLSSFLFISTEERR